MFFEATDVLRVEFEFRNKSSVDVAMRLRWFSIPSAGLRHSLELLPEGFRHACVQKVSREYEASAILTGCAFRQDGQRLESDWEEVSLGAKGTLVRRFEIRFQDAVPAGKPLDLAGAIESVEARYASLPPLAEHLRRFEPWHCAPSASSSAAGSSRPIRTATVFLCFTAANAASRPPGSGIPPPRCSGAV
jgi:hypothetical protein